MDTPTYRPDADDDGGGEVGEGRQGLHATSAEPAVLVDAAALARVGTALADDTRRRLLLTLLHGPAFPADLAERLKLTRGNVSNHLGCLRGCGLVRTTPVGRRVRYELADSRLAHALADLTSLTLLTDHDSPDNVSCDPESSCCPPGDSGRERT